MKASAWNQFTQIRDHYRKEIKRLIRKMPQLQGNAKVAATEFA